MVQERPVRVERRLAAILTADVAGYSRLMHSDEEATHARLTALLTEAVHPAIAEHGFPFWIVSALWARGAGLLRLGRPSEALVAFEEALTNLRAIGGLTGAPWILTSRAEAFGKIGRSAEAFEQLDEAAQQIEATQERWSESNMHRVSR
jgi:class 3 adenylate cyclase